MPSPKSATKPKPSINLAFEAIGTQWQINFIADEARGSTVADSIINKINVFDRNYSRFRADSLVTSISQGPTQTMMPNDFGSLYSIYQQLYEATGGLVTPLIGLAMADAGYDTAYSFQPRAIRATPEWDDAIEYHDGVLTTHQAVMLDFGAAGKGYLVDIVSDLLQQHGVGNFVIDAGGDICQRGPAAEYIGLEYAADTTKVIGLAKLQNASICCSSGNRRAWGEYNHILNPRTKSSPKHIAAVWVIAESTRLADAIATGLFFTDPDGLGTLGAFEYLISFQDGRYEQSESFPVRFFDTPKLYELS